MRIQKQQNLDALLPLPGELSGNITPAHWISRYEQANAHEDGCNSPEDFLAHLYKLKDRCSILKGALSFLLYRLSFQGER